MKRTILAINLLALLFFAPDSGAAESKGPMVAVAANFMGAMEEISAAYRTSTGIKVETVYSSTGKLYAQIKNGAPFDLFLAADQKRPELLADEGICTKPFVYATGQAVLWSRAPVSAGVKNWREAVLAAENGRIAIASPETAPYGAAALAAIEAAGFRERLTPRLVYGQNIAQPFQYAYQGSAVLAFTALSFALSNQGGEGRYWPIPEAPVVYQEGCLVKTSARREAAAHFLKFLRGPGSGAILAAYGYR